MGVPGSLIDGLNLLLAGNGKIFTARGAAASTASGAPRPSMNVKSTYGGVSNYGTLASFYNVFLVAGSGTVTLTGSSLGTVSNALAINTSGGLVLAGIPAPGAPTVSATPVVSGSIVGAYSLALTAVRVLGNVTGESSRGTPSATVYLSNKKFAVTGWPAIPTGCDASRDKWGLYFPFRGFPTQGPWRHLMDVPMNTPASVGSPYLIDFTDGLLGHLAPLDHDPPPTAHFLFTIDNVVTVVGPGGQLNPSVPLQPDAFPPDKTVFLARGEDVTSCRGAGASGRIALACANSLHEVFSSGSDDISPIISIPRWPSVGFTGASSWCFVGDIIFGMSSVGPVLGTLDDQPDNAFANDVMSYFEENGWTSANTVAGYDPKTKSGILIKDAIGLPFSFTNRKWSTPYQFPGNVATAVTVGNQLLCDIGGTMYIYEGGAASPPSFHGTFAWQDDSSPFLKTLVRVRAASDTQITIQPLTDLSVTPAVSSFTSEAQHGVHKRLNIRDLTSLTFKFSGTGAHKTIDPLRVQVIEHPVTNVNS
jgi:hypothetical protein